MDITELMVRFRLASRELFNHFFRISDPYQNDGWVYQERFRDVENVLFQKLVTEPASIQPMQYGSLQTEISVTLACGEFAPAMINRDIDSGYWDYPVDQINSDATLSFISFFDWDVLGCRDNQFVRAKILNWPSQPECIGKHVLLDAQNVKYNVGP